MTLLLALLLSADPATSHQVSIPLDDYEQLRKQSERPALTVIDLLRVEGSFAKRDLSIALAGRASGTWPTVEILQAEGARLHSCEGEALLSRADSGAFAVTPLAPRFTLRCKVALDGGDRLAAQTTAAVLEVVSSVSDGELVASSEGAGRSISVVRRFAGSEGPDLPPAVTGRYLVTLLPDETRFEYRLEVRNPARGHRRFEVELRAAEHVEGVDTKAPWDAEGTRYRFDLPPGETVLALRGRLSEPRFVPPVAASLQYLLVQSHPLLRPELTTEAKRVGVGETGLAAGFRGAQAFLLDGGAGAPAAEVSWTATKLQALKTAGIALSRLDQIFFLGTDGVARAESTLMLDNQGAPAITLPGAGYTFASLGGEPVFLTHDKDGKLFLPLGQGPQALVVQEKQPFGRRYGIGLASLELPQLAVPASEAAIQLRYPAEWLPVYEELAPASRWHLLDLTELAALLLLVALAERLLALGGVSARRRWLLALSLALAGAFLPALRVTAVAVLVFAWLALGGALVVQRLKGAARVLAVLAGAGAAFIVFVSWGASFSQARFAAAPAADMSAYTSSRMDKFGEEEAVKTKGLEGSMGKGAELNSLARAQGAAAEYEGLPAKIVIPYGARQTQFQRELLPLETPRRVTALVVAAWFVSGLATAAVLVFLALAVLFRRSLAAGALAIVARVRTSAPAAPPVTSAS